MEKAQNKEILVPQLIAFDISFRSEPKNKTSVSKVGHRWPDLIPENRTTKQYKALQSILWDRKPGR